MPIFEYRCERCGHVSSFLEKSDSRRKHTCQECGSADTEKVFSTFSARAHKPAPPSCSGQCESGTCPYS